MEKEREKSRLETRLLTRSSIKRQWNGTASQCRPESPFSILFHSRRVVIIPGGWPGCGLNRTHACTRDARTMR